MITGNKAGIARIWELETGKEVFTLRQPDYVTSVGFTHDGQYALTASSDGTIRIWSLVSGEEILSLAAVDSIDFIAYTPDGYYTCSKGGLHGVGFRFANTVYPFEQFDLKFNRPDIIMQRIGYADPALIETYHRAYLRRLRKMGFKEEELSAEMHLPEVKLDWKSVPASTDQRKVNLSFTAWDDKYLLDRMNIFVNDVTIFGVRGINLRDQKIQQVERTLPIELSAGTNKIQVSVHNEKGVESLKETVYVTYTGPAVKPDLYLIAIGVSQYQDSRYNLAYASADATNLGSLFAGQEGDKFGKVHVKYILDSDATRENIIAAKKFFQQSHVDDMAMVFVAGHGLVDSEYNYYFGTYDVDHVNPALRGLPYEEIDNLLDGIPARKKVLFLDTCFSGEIEKSEVQLVSADPAETGVRGAIRKRSFTRAIAVTEKVLDNAVMIQQDMFADLRRGTGAVVISSSAGGEYSLESPEWQGGVFTYAVIEGLRQRKADNNKDKQIQVSELQSYVFDRVKQLSHGEQHPTVRQENLADDFIVY